MSMVSAPICCSMMSGWNWLKLDSEKKTVMMLVVRSMLRLPSSRSTRASA